MSLDRQSLWRCSDRYKRVTKSYTVLSVFILFHCKRYRTPQQYSTKSYMLMLYHKVIKTGCAYNLIVLP